MWAAIKRNAPRQEWKQRQTELGGPTQKETWWGEEAEFRMRQQGKYLGEYKTYMEERLIIGNCWGREGFRWTPEGKGPFWEERLLEEALGVWVGKVTFNYEKDAA